MPATMWASGASKEKPAITPTVSITAIESELVAMSARVRPASRAERAIGSERKRSTSPFFRSSERPRAVTKPPKDIVWTMIPGIRKST
jgi:hypothetical protein